MILFHGSECDVNGSFKCFNLLQDLDFAEKFVAENTFCLQGYLLKK